MGWKTINGRPHFYKSEREGGRVRTTYFGAGEPGRLMALLIAADREEREAERKQRRAEREASDAEERAVWDWFDAVQAVADAALRAAGFHKHRGQWRRRRTMGEAVTVRYAADGEVARQVIDRALRGDEGCVPELRALLAEGKRGRQLMNAVGSPAEWLRQTIGRRAGGKNLLVREGLLRKLAEVQAELEGPDPTPLERLLAERAATCWFLVNWHERTFEDASGLSVAQAEYLQRKIDRAHAGFLSAVRALAQVRKLAVPALQMNIARNQVNVAEARS
jgi:hypothetical protein